MKTIVSALVALVALAFLAAPEARAQGGGCTSSTYNLGDAGGDAYSLDICEREVKLSRDGFVFFDAMVNDEGPFLEGSIRYGDRCGPQTVPASSEEVPDWYRGLPPKLVIRMQQPTFDAACRAIGESEVVYQFVSAAAVPGAGGVGSAGECWLVVYGLFERAEYDTAKQLVQRIGPGTAVVDTDPIASLPKSRFAVVSGPHSASDADSVQRNTRPVAPNAIVMRANDCGDVGGAPGGAAALSPPAPPMPGLPVPGGSPELVPFGGSPAAATGAPPGMTLYGSPPAAGGPPGLTPFGGAPAAATGTPPGLTPFGGAPATGTPPGLTPFGGTPAAATGTPSGLTPFGGAPAAGTGTPSGLTPFGGAPATGTPPAGLTPFGTVPPKPLPPGVKPVG